MIKNIKKFLKNANAINIICCTICTIWIFISFWNDFHFFDFSHTPRISYFVTSGNPYSVFYYIIIKLIFIFLMYAFSLYVAHCIKGVINKDEKIISLVKIYLTIALIYGFILLLIYPGVWFNNGRDEMQLFEFSRNLQVQYHQGVLTSIYYIIALMIWPKPITVVLFQLLIGTLILGNIINDISKKSKMYWLIYLVIFSPAALYMANYPLRAYLFSCFFLAFLHYYMKFKNKENIKIGSIYFLTFLVCIIVNFRIEAMFLILLFPFLIYKMVPKKHVLYATSIVLVSLVLFSGINKLGFQGARRSHNSISLIGPLSLYLADESQNHEKFENDIKKIDKVFDVEDLKENAATDYNGGSREDDEYSKQDYHNFLISSMNILIHNPKYVFKAKLTEGAKALGINSLSFVNKLLKTSEFSKIGFYFPDKFESPVKKSQKYFSDFNSKRHNYFAHILAGQFKILNVKAYDIFYAFWIPCLAIFIVLIVSLKRKDYVLFTACSIITIHFILTIFTSPIGAQIYYFPEYLIGYYLFITEIIFKFKNKNLKLHT